MASHVGPSPREIAVQLDRDLRALPPESRTPDYRAIRRAYSRTLKTESGAFVICAARSLIRDFDRRWVAYELVRYHRGAFAQLDAELLQDLGRGIDSWSSVDAFARTLAGPAWLLRLVDDALIHSWARSGDRWWRRAALVSTVELNVRSHGGSGDMSRTLALCELLADDRDDMVVKALSWALRELVVHDAPAVRAFVAEHDHALAARVKREVRNKLETGLKNP